MSQHEGIDTHIQIISKAGPFGGNFRFFDIIFGGFLV